MESTYDEMAEFHEIFMHTAWDRLRDVMRETFADLGSGSVIVDIGAGSGMGSAMLADITDAELIALEPNTTMRSMMMARLDQAGVLERVTVLAEPVPDGLGRLPERTDGVVATHMLGHLTEADRISLLEWIATSLAPGRSALLTVSAELPEEGVGSVVEERTVGRSTYRATYDMPSPDRYEALWEVIDQNQEVIRSVRDGGDWVSVAAADIQMALADHPVEVTEPLPAVVLIRRPTTT